jgi:hypothetical protein
MNNVNVMIFLGLLTIASSSQAENDQTVHETKTVCHDTLGKNGKPVTDKNGKVKQNCKKVKIHKKFEGTVVPDKKAGK